MPGIHIRFIKQAVSIITKAIQAFYGIDWLFLCSENHSWEHDGILHDGLQASLVSEINYGLFFP